MTSELTEPLASQGDEQVLVTRAELWSLGADLHAPGRTLWLAENAEGAVVEDVRERLLAFASRPAHVLRARADELDPGSPAATRED